MGIVLGDGGSWSRYCLCQSVAWRGRERERVRLDT